MFIEGVNKIILKFLVFKLDVILIFNDIVDIVFYNFSFVIMFGINLKNFIVVRLFFTFCDMFLKVEC